MKIIKTQGTECQEEHDDIKFAGNYTIRGGQTCPCVLVQVCSHGENV